jgi:hypothetical protein
MDSRAPARRRRLVLGALYTAVILNLVLSLLLFAYVIVLKDSRDTEQQRIKDQLQINNCSLMDQLPAGGSLDRLRAIYHCGPGLSSVRG